MCSCQVYLKLLSTILIIKKDSSGLTWQAAKHPTAIVTSHYQWDARENWRKKVKLMGKEKDS